MREGFDEDAEVPERDCGVSVGDSILVALWPPLLMFGVLGVEGEDVLLSSSSW